MKLKFSFLMALPFVLLGTQGNAQTQRESVVDENGRIQFTVKPQQGNNSTVFSKLNPTALNLDWNGPESNVSRTPTVDSFTPSLAVGSDNSAYIVDNTDYAPGTDLQKIMFSKKTGETTWSEPIMVDKGGEIGERNTLMPEISAAPNGDLHVVYDVWAFDNFRHYMGYSHYNAATETWSDGVKISDLGGTIQSLNSSSEIYNTEDSLPVVLWDYDNRSGNEAVYLTYFDGTNWSSDIAISQLQPGYYGFGPKMISIGNHKALILYTEYIDGLYESRYRFYNEITHEISDPKVIDLGGLITYEFYPSLGNDGNLNIIFKYRDEEGLEQMRIATYNITADTFSVKEAFKELPNLNGGAWSYGADCNKSGDCAILLTDFFQSVSLITYSPDSGFSNMQTLVAQSSNDDKPLAKFDALGNLHTAWADTRLGKLKRETYYKEAKNLNLGTDNVNKTKISVYPNPFKDALNISDVQNVKSVSVNDMTGRTIKNLAPSSQLNLSNLKEGVYLVNLNMKDGSIQTVKVIKK